MAQEGSTSNGNNNNAPPATNFGSMSPEESKTGIQVGAATDKGKGILKAEEESGSKGKSSADVVTADGATAGGSGAGGGRTGGNGRHGDRNVHIVLERERRKRMRDMFTNLQNLLPNLPDKTNKTTMVEVAIDYIKSLEVTLAELEKRKLEMKLAQGQRGAADAGASSSAAPPPAASAPTQAILPVAAHGRTPPAGAVTAAPAPAGLQTWSGPNVVLSVSGDDAYINVCAGRRQGVMTMVAAVLEKHRIDLVTSEIASDDSRSMFMIHTRVNNGARNQFGEKVASEEIYKLAASEIMVWLSN